MGIDKIVNECEHRPLHILYRQLAQREMNGLSQERFSVSLLVYKVASFIVFQHREYRCDYVTRWGDPRRTFIHYLFSWMHWRRAGTLIFLLRRNPVIARRLVVPPISIGSMELLKLNWYFID